MKFDRRRLLAGGAGAISAAVLARGALAEQGAVPATAHHPDMFDTLRASGPRSVAGEDPAARLFDRFAGSWDIAYCNIKDDGSREHTRGELWVGWILDGRALQDIWIEYPAAGGDRFMGTTLRFYDTQRKTWRITWVSPLARAVTLLEGGDEDGQIVLRAQVPRGLLRWTFSDMTDGEFHWRGEISTDAGATWRLREDHRMQRRSRAAA